MFSGSRRCHDVEMIRCTAIPNTFLVETLSKRINIYITRPLSRLWTIYADGRPADIVAPFTARRTAAIAYTANAQGRLSELEPDCS